MVTSKKSLSYSLAIMVVASLLFGPVTLTYAEGVELPEAYKIKDVPYHTQQTEFYCAFTSLEMVFDYYGPDIPAPEIIAVENMPAFYFASYGEATQYYWTCLTREAHFSNLSTSHELYRGFKITGYSERDLGYAAFFYARWEPWLEELKALIAQDYPIIVSQWFDFYKEARHCRVVIGYDDTTGEVIFHDPWDRGQSALLYYGQGTISEQRTLGEESRLSYEDFINLWGDDYLAVFVAPWSVDISVELSTEVDEFTVTACVTYPCPAPFYEWGHWWFPAQFANVTISLPNGLTLADGESATKRGPDWLLGGDSFSAAWNVVAKSSGEYTISVQAEGIINDRDAHGIFYTDRIGGVGEGLLVAT